MKSILKLYEVEFKPELNPLVENLADYLAQCERTTYNDFQHMKHNLAIAVKVPMDQMYVDNFPFNYASIQNENESIFYYYIMDINWVAQGTVVLTLGMDTVNTLGQPGSLGHPSMFTEETHIYRQHGDRFYDTGERDQAGGKLLRRNIDREVEGINAPKQLTSTVVQRDSVFGEDKWALMFKTGIEGGIDTEGPLDVFLVPEEPYQVRIPGSTGTVVWNVANFDTGTYYYMVGSENPNGQFVATEKDGTSRTYTVPSDGYIVIQAKPGQYDPETIVFSVLVMKNEGNEAVQDGTVYLRYRTIEFLAGSKLRYGISGPTTGQAFAGKITYFKTSTILSTYDAYVSIAPNVATTTLKTLQDVDRYDSKIVKIINLPYCPLDITKAADGTYAIPEGWEISEGYLKWGRNLLPNLTRENATNFTRNLTDYWYPAPKQAKETARESKLFHSEFFTLAAVYDSFAKEIALERFDLSETDPGRITVGFKQTNTLGNNALFKFNFDDFAPYETVENYEQYMLVDRNNEEPIFTSDYVNYLRSGYQYDVAANKIAQGRAWTETITSTIGAAANSAIAIGKGIESKNVYWNTTENRPATPMEDLIGGTGFKDKKIYSLKEGTTPIVAQTAVGSLTNLAGSITNLVTLYQTQKLQMGARLADLQMRSVGVSGSGTIDLLEEYNGNALNIMTYEPRLNVKRRLYEFFDYFGYSHDYYEVPNVSSRYWYNYIQCSPMLVEEGTGKYKEAWLEDLKTRYEVGVVVFHDRNDEWNFKRRWENWETWVITE